MTPLLYACPTTPGCCCSHWIVTTQCRSWGLEDLWRALRRGHPQDRRVDMSARAIESRPHRGGVLRRMCASSFRLHTRAFWCARAQRRVEWAHQFRVGPPTIGTIRSVSTATQPQHHTVFVRPRFSPSPTTCNCVRRFLCDGWHFCGNTVFWSLHCSSLRTVRDVRVAALPAPYWLGYGKRLYADTSPTPSRERFRWVLCVGLCRRLSPMLTPRPLWRYQPPSPPIVFRLGIHGHAETRKMIYPWIIFFWVVK